jgi:aldehyde:ferredoxin oxidoreductase
MKGDAEKMLRLMDQFYALRGWDVQSGRPKRSTLIRLGLEDVAIDLVERKTI